MSATNLNKDTAAHCKRAAIAKYFVGFTKPIFANNLNIIGAVYTLRHEYERNQILRGVKKNVTLRISQIYPIYFQYRPNYKLLGQFQKVHMLKSRMNWQARVKHWFMSWDRHECMQLYQGLSRYKEALKYEYCQSKCKLYQ
jgi:hypothetical protein